MPKKKGVVKILEFPRKTAQFEDDFGFYGIKFYVADIEVIRLLLFLPSRGCLFDPSNYISKTAEYPTAESLPPPYCCILHH